MKTNLLTSYNCRCAVCNSDFTIEPSILMEMGFNVGHTSCPNCNTFLHLEIMPDINGIQMKSETWDSLSARLREEFKQEVV